MLHIALRVLLKHNKLRPRVPHVQCSMPSETQSPECQGRVEWICQESNSPGMSITRNVLQQSRLPNLQLLIYNVRSTYCT